jgi:hypothetical protein
MFFLQFVQRFRVQKWNALFEIGPSPTVKASAHARLDVAPLFGTTSNSPHVDLFRLFFIDFGTGAEKRFKRLLHEEDSIRNNVLVCKRMRSSAGFASMVEYNPTLSRGIVTTGLLLIRHLTKQAGIPSAPKEFSISA